MATALLAGAVELLLDWYLARFERHTLGNHSAAVVVDHRGVPDPSRLSVYAQGATSNALRCRPLAI